MALVQERPQPAAEINTLLGKGSEFEGKLTFEGTVRIDGKLRGEIFSEDILVIGEGAEVHAEIDIGTVIIEGSVVGNVRAKKGVEIHAPGKMRGNITTPSLFIDKGVVFDGNCKMESLDATRPVARDKDVKAMAQAAQAVAQAGKPVTGAPAGVQAMGPGTLPGAADGAKPVQK